MRPLVLISILALSLSCISCNGDSPDIADGDSDSNEVDLDDSPDPGDGDSESESSEILDEEDGDGEELPLEDDISEFEELQEVDEDWEFDRDGYQPISGWILLDANPDAVRESIETAAEYGINHIHLSHGLIMNIDEILGDDPGISSKIDTLNLGIDLAHQYGIKASIWVHEFSGTGLDVCYAPDDPIWEQRAEAYRNGLSRLPGLDGVILMFGSAPSPPWYNMCTCEWCTENYDAPAWEAPPAAERLRMIIENIGGVIVNELGKELFVRTFVHEPAEIGWHSEGLASVRGVEFTGMHKGPVQDWQPYNPHHACIGNIGPHPGIIELDVAGEYYGSSELPFCSPGYYWYRLNHSAKNNGIGSVIRIQRGSAHALGTPNEINIRAVQALSQNPGYSLDTIWSEFVDSFYAPGDQEAKSKLIRILKRSFPIRRKCHYVLGIWAHDKNSDFPVDTNLDQFKDRGEMPKWDADWLETWNFLDKTDKPTVVRIWQEATEAVELAESSLDEIEMLQGSLEEQKYNDLHRRMLHQYHSSEAWRASKLFIWARRAALRNPEDMELKLWANWGRQQMQVVMGNMISAGLSDVRVAGPSRAQHFLDNTQDFEIPAVEGVTAGMPELPLFSPIEIEYLSPTSVRLKFSLRRPANISIDLGTEIPDYGQEIEIGPKEAENIEVEIVDLNLSTRYVVRLKTSSEASTRYGGDYWIFTH